MDYFAGADLTNLGGQPQSSDPQQAQADRDYYAQQLGLPTGLSETDYLSAHQELMASPEWAQLQADRQAQNDAQGAAGLAAYEEGKDERRKKFATTAAVMIGGAALASVFAGGAAGAGSSATASAPTGVADGLAPIVAGNGAAIAAPLAGGTGAAAGLSAAGATMAALPPAIATSAASGALTGAVSAVAPTLFTRVGSFLSNNRDIIGSVLAGVGEQLVAADVQSDALREEHELISSNYSGTNPGRGYRSTAENTSSRRPRERFASANIGGYHLRFDPIEGKIVRELMPAQGT